MEPAIKFPFESRGKAKKTAKVPKALAGPHGPLYSTQEAADYLGVSRSLFYSTVIPHLAKTDICPGKLLFAQSELDRYIAERTSR